MDFPQQSYIPWLVEHNCIWDEIQSLQQTSIFDMFTVQHCLY